MDYVRRTDSGRKLLSIATLSIGGAVIFMTLTSIGYTWLYKKNSPADVDAFAAIVGCVVAFLYLAKVFHIFDRKK